MGQSSSTSAADKAMAQEFVEGEIERNPVVVFSKTYCPYCKMAKTTLNEANAKFKLIELDERDDGDAIQDILLSITGARTVPRVFIKRKCVGGGTDVRDLMQAGKLVPMLKDAGAL